MCFTLLLCGCGGQDDGNKRSSSGPGGGGGSSGGGMSGSFVATSPKCNALADYLETEQRCGDR
jgi:hypothetical protein